ncbi:secretory protein [Chitinophaga sp. XS-30]|nr:secretory protein [Chitinophaga sp. XS-30]
MKKIYKTLAVSCLLLAGLSVHAQRNNGWRDIETGVVSKDSVTRGEYTLIFVNKSEGFSPALKERMIETFFTVYPEQAKIYNPKTAKKVTFIINPKYDGVAATAGTYVHYNPGWFDKNPGDIDVVTHEVMHIIQSYRGGEGWITEGIADYVRATMGVDNEGAGWSMPAFKPEHSYKNAYRITARFFIWLEKNAKSGIIVKLDSAMRSKTYTDEFWKTETGKTVDELWAEYAKNPVI